MPSTPYIQGRNVLKTFRIPGSSRSFTALDVPSLDVSGGERVALVGPSGSGKTTLLNIIAGLLDPTQGTVVVNGFEVTAMNERQRDRFRAENIGYIFQSFNLLAAFNALENVLMAMDLAEIVPARSRKRIAEALLTDLGLGLRLRHRPGQLSIGEQQRVAVARALANSPSIILADEPTASVDPETREVVISRLLDTSGETGAMLLVATHDEGLQPRFDRVVRLRTAPVAQAAGREI